MNADAPHARVKTAGGFARLHEMLSVIKEVGGRKKFKDLVDAMARLLYFLGITVGGYAGWAAGQFVGLGLRGAFLVSSLGSIAGIYLVWRFGGDYLT